MHTVPPVVFGIGRIINSFFLRIFPAQCFTHSYYILQLENAPHSRRIKMLQHHRPVDPGFTKLWCVAPLTHQGIVKMLCTLPVFLPPSPYSTHIMRGRRNDGHIRRIIGMKEFLFGVFWHPLNFQTKNAQLLHYIRYTMRHHTQVFTTYQHIGGCFQLRQFMHGFFKPEIILAAVEIINVE